MDTDHMRRTLEGNAYERFFIVWYGGADHKVNRYKIERSVSVHIKGGAIIQTKEAVELTPDQITQLFVGCLKDGNLPNNVAMAEVAHMMHVASMEVWVGEPVCDCHNPDSPCPIHTGEPFGEVTS